MNSLNRIKYSFIGKFLHLRHLILFLTVLPPGLVHAQPKFSAVASSNEIGRNDYVQVEYVVENAQQIEHLLPPTFRDFNIVQGPIQSSSMSVVNGVVTQYKSLAFVLQPVKTGHFTIPGAKAEVDGKSLQSNALKIVVTAGGSGGSSSLPAPRAMWPEPEPVNTDYMLKPGENIDEKIRKNLFVKVLVSKTSCYVGEPIVATYKLYSHLQSESRVSKHPSLNGFSVYDMVDPNSTGSTVETVNGKPFSVHIIRKAQLIPLQAGMIDLDPLEVENTVHFIKTGKSAHAHGNSMLRDMFDMFPGQETGGVPVEQHVNIESKPVTISVKPLPEENKPADFNGAVGHFSIASGIANSHLTAQDAAILKITVKGEGNLPVVNAPTVEWPKGVESYDASAKEDIDKTVAPLGGSKSFEYSFVPKRPGEYVIPAVSFSYFDPQTASYKTVKSQPLDFRVAVAKNKPAGSATSYLSEPTQGVSGGFIAFLQQHLEWFFAVLILSSLAVYLWFQNRRLKKAGQQEAIAVQAPPPATVPEVEKIPVDLLQRAKYLFQRSEYKAFYSELNRVLWNAAEDKLNLPGSEMNKQNIVRKLKAAGWDETTTQSLEQIFRECEMKLYTPAYDATDMERILRQTEDILIKLDKL